MSLTLRIGLWVFALVALIGCGPDLDKSCRHEGMSLIVIDDFSEEDFEPPICVDIHLASRVDASETSAGRDESFAVSQAGAIPWTDLTWEEALLACGRAGKMLCDVQVLRVIGPSAEPGTGRQDEPVKALSPTGPETSFPNHPEPIDPNFGGEWEFPETRDSIAVWGAPESRKEGEIYPADQPLIFGTLSADGSSGQATREAPVRDKAFQHPLLGFRCCIDSRLDGVLDPFPLDPGRVLEKEPNVPISGEDGGQGAAGAAGASGEEP